jgi:excisionase family DNA binding protein
MVEALFTLDEVAEKLRVPVATVRYWRHQGTGPKSFRMGKRVLVAESALAAFIADQQAAAR